MEIENVFRSTARAVGLMEIENIIQYAPFAVGLKPSAMRGEARCAGYIGLFLQRPYSHVVGLQGECRFPS